MIDAFRITLCSVLMLMYTTALQANPMPVYEVRMRTCPEPSVEIGYCLVVETREEPLFTVTIPFPPGDPYHWQWPDWRQWQWLPVPPMEPLGRQKITLAQQLPTFLQHHCRSLQPLDCLQSGFFGSERWYDVFQIPTLELSSRQVNDSEWLSEGSGNHTDTDFPGPVSHWGWPEWTGIAVSSTAVVVLSLAIAFTSWKLYQWRRRLIHPAPFDLTGIDSRRPVMRGIGPADVPPVPAIRDSVISLFGRWSVLLDDLKNNGWFEKLRDNTLAQ